MASTALQGPGKTTGSRPGWTPPSTHPQGFRGGGHAPKSVQRGFYQTSQGEKPSKPRGTYRTRITSPCSDDHFSLAVSLLLLLSVTHPWHIRFFRMTLVTAVLGPGTELQRPLAFPERWELLCYATEGTAWGGGGPCVAAGWGPVTQKTKGRIRSVGFSATENERSITWSRSPQVTAL